LHDLKGSSQTPGERCLPRQAEMDKPLAALKRNRHGHRDWLIGLII
jgi:hypothetical protein